MPPRTRTHKLSKASKENFISTDKISVKNIKSTERPRKALADKTNSASDDNASIVEKSSNLNKSSRPRRDRRLPSRFADNKVLINLSTTPIKIKSNETGKNKARPKKTADNKVLINLSTTPIKVKNKQTAKNKASPTETADNKVLINLSTTPIKIKSNKIAKNKASPTKTKLFFKSNKQSVLKCNNRNVNESSNPQKSYNKIISKKFSLGLFEKKDEPVDIYDFTFDPNEEPPPQKKKRKRTVKRKPKAQPQTKTFIVKNNYNTNISNAIENLKSIVTKRTIGNIAVTQHLKSDNNNHKEKLLNTREINNCSTPQVINSLPPFQNEDAIQNQITEPIEENPIQLDIIPEHDIDSTPASPFVDPTTKEVTVLPQEATPHPDPFNLREELSFFDEEPIANSTLNISNKHPLASPWRIEFENLPIKWGVNTYVKPNMTPAVESSFMNFEDTKKKHVYTNMVPSCNDSLPEIVTETDPKLKQTSMLSFIRDVVDKSVQRKKNKHATTPTKTNSVFKDNHTLTSGSDTSNSNQWTPRKATPSKNGDPDESTPVRAKDSQQNAIENNSDKGRTPLKRKISTSPCEISPGNDEVVATVENFFGFDESENNDQENVSPNPKIDKKRVRRLGLRPKAVLREVNHQTGPSRIKLPTKSIFAPNSEAVNNLYEQMKSTNDAPVLPAKSQAIEKDNTVVDDSHIEELSTDCDGNDVNPLLLFEDVEVVHHLKPNRKSYGKTRKVTFQQSASDNEIPNMEMDDTADGSDGEDSTDLPFKAPVIKIRKVAKKKAKVLKRSKKEEKEAEAWAAGFNSMCEDIEEFDLVVE